MTVFINENANFVGEHDICVHVAYKQIYWPSFSFFNNKSSKIRPFHSLPWMVYAWLAFLLVLERYVDVECVDGVDG